MEPHPSDGQYLSTLTGAFAPKEIHRLSGDADGLWAEAAGHCAAEEVGRDFQEHWAHGPIPYQPETLRVFLWAPLVAPVVIPSSSRVGLLIDVLLEPMVGMFAGTAARLYAPASVEEEQRALHDLKRFVETMEPADGPLREDQTEVAAQICLTLMRLLVGDAWLSLAWNECRGETWMMRTSMTACKEPVTFIAPTWLSDVRHMNVLRAFERREREQDSRARSLKFEIFTGVIMFFQVIASREAERERRFPPDSLALRPMYRQYHQRFLDALLAGDSSLTAFRGPRDQAVQRLRGELRSREDWD